MSTDLKQQLRRQLDFLQTSCDLYDSEKREEAIRIAVGLRVLFHNTKNSTSLLRHLGATSINLLSTCEKIPKGAPFFHNLTVIHILPPDLTFDCKPKLGTAHSRRMVAFQKWWDQEVVYLFDRHKKIRRKDLILYAANKDGGAHVDSNLPPDYEMIINGLGWKMSFKHPHGVEEETKLRFAQFAPLRQMAFEALNSPDLLNLCK
jgi:hypothetical protein